MICTTLGAIKRAHPCNRGWRTLMLALGYAPKGKFPEEQRVPLWLIAHTNDMHDALWAAYRCGRGYEIRHALARFSDWCDSQHQSANQARPPVFDPRKPAQSAQRAYSAMVDRACLLRLHSGPDTLKPATFYLRQCLGDPRT